VVPKPQQQHDGNYTNTLVQPVHPANRKILKAHMITEYMEVFSPQQRIVKVCSDVLEKCTASVFRVTEQSSGECWSNWEE
jgi:hypothetical protein